VETISSRKQNGYKENGDYSYNIQS